MRALSLEPSIECYTALCEAYSEKHRFYHTGKHIDAMLGHFDSVQGLSERPGELELAIWFHDAIYKPLSSKNEIDSAKWAQTFLCANDYDQDGVERVVGLIMATIHNGDVQGSEEKLIVDVDLTILGSPEEVYDQFERNVRKEYRLVPSLIYRKKRKELLKAFLTMDSIYNTDHFKNKYEAMARGNINRAIEML